MQIRIPLKYATQGMLQWLQNVWYLHLDQGVWYQLSLLSYKPMKCHLKLTGLKDMALLHRLDSKLKDVLNQHIFCPFTYIHQSLKAAAICIPLKWTVQIILYVFSISNICKSYALLCLWTITYSVPRANCTICKSPSTSESHPLSAIFVLGRLRTTSRRAWRQRWLSCNRVPSTTTRRPCWKWAPISSPRQQSRHASWQTLRHR